MSARLKCNLLSILVMVSLYIAGALGSAGSYWSLLPSCLGGFAMGVLQYHEWKRGLDECRVIYKRALERFGVRQIEVDHD